MEQVENFVQGIEDKVKSDLSPQFLQFLQTEKLKLAEERHTSLTRT